MWMLLISLALAADRVDLDAPDEPSYPTVGVGLGIGLGTFETVLRARVDRAVFEPFVGMDAQVFGVPRTSEDVESESVLDVASLAGLDIRGLPYLTRRWEIGVLGGVAWRGRWQTKRVDGVDADEPDSFRTHSHDLSLRAGAGVGFRPGPKSTLGLDVIASLVDVTLARERLIGAGPKADRDPPDVRVQPRIGLRLLWTFWAGPPVPVTDDAP